VKKLFMFLLGLLISVVFTSSAFALNVFLYVDSAPNVYGSPDYQSWEDNAYAAASNGTFVNMANGENPDNVGSTNFDIRDEVVYSFGDLGKRLHWIYWIPDTTIAELTGNFEIKLENYWDGEYLDFYDSYYDSTWLEPTKWKEYNGGVIGSAGMAWWGAYGTNTPDALNADIAEWITAEETWIFTARLGDNECSIESYRAPVPEPTTSLFMVTGLAILVCVQRRRFFKK
jgi:hypothetical protein